MGRRLVGRSHGFSRGWAVLPLGVALMVTMAACGSSSKKTTTGATGTTAAGGSSSSPGTMFSTASVSGLGTVLVDASGKTVYLLETADHKNANCDDASGCTKIWPDLPFPSGTTSATAGSGVQQSKLSSKKLADGETYPTYNGWLMYEYTGDTGPAQGHGEGIQSFGGTWYALSPSGDPVTSSGGGGTATTTGSSGGGY